MSSILWINRDSYLKEICATERSKWVSYHHDIERLETPCVQWLKITGRFGNGRHAEIMSIAGDVTPAIWKRLAMLYPKRILRDLPLFSRRFFFFCRSHKAKPINTILGILGILGNSPYFHPTSSSGFSEPKCLPRANNPDSRDKVTNLLPLNRLAKSFITF